MRATPASIAGWIIAGMCVLGVSAVALIGWAQSRVLHPSELDPEFRQEIDLMYQKYKRGHVEYQTSLPICGAYHSVAIIESVHGAEYGFVAFAHDRLWIHDSGKFAINRYNDSHCFVAISDHYARQLAKTPFSSGDAQ